MDTDGDVIILLKKIAATDDSILLTSFDLERGVSIQIGKEIIASELPNRKEYSKWDKALKSCLIRGYVKQENKNFYVITNAGYKYIEEYDNSSLPVESKKSLRLFEKKILESGQTLAYTLGTVINTLESSFEKRILYASSLITDDEITMFKMDAARSVDVNENHLDVSNHKLVYRRHGMANFKRRVDEFKNQNVIVSAKVGDVQIESRTTFDNWKSKSYANNVLSAEDYECTIWFKIISEKGNLCMVQILIIAES